MDISQTVRSILDVDHAENVIEYKEVWTDWGQLKSAVDDAVELLDDLPSGDLRIGVMIRNNPESIAMILATLVRNSCLVTINPVYPDTRLCEDVEKLACPVLIGARADFSRVAMVDAVKSARCIEVAAGEDGDLRANLFRAGQIDVFENPMAQGISIEMMTSGTTGPPKRIPLRRNRFEKSMHDFALYERDREGPPRLRSGVQIISNSLAHISGIGAATNSILAGRKLCVLEKFNVESFHSAVKRHKPKVISIPPAAMKMLLDAEPPALDFESVLALRTGTAPLDPKLAMDFQDYFGFPVLQNYGATEFAGGVAGWTMRDHQKYGRDKADSVGRMNPGIDARIVDVETGEVVEHGVKGILELKANHLGDGKNWLRTTDLAALDEDGFLFILGRVDGAIIRGGFKIQPEDVANALKSHESIRDACIVGLADERLGQVPVAAFTTQSKDGVPTDEDLTSYLRELLSPYQLPVRFAHLPELPRTPSMKVDQAAVRAIFE